MPFAEQQLPGVDGKSLVFNFWAASGLVGFVAGVAGDLPAISRVTMQQMALMLWSVCLGTITFASNYTCIVGIVVLLGLCDGVMACVVVPILFDLLGPAGASAGLGSVFGLMAPLAVIGPFLTGGYAVLT